MTSWLSAAWFEEALALAADLPEERGVSATIQWEVTGTEAGTSAYFVVVEDGVVVSWGAGRARGADVVLTATAADAREINEAELDPNVAFMQGRMKAAGSMRTLLALLPLARTPERRDVQRRIAAITDY